MNPQFNQMMGQMLSKPNTQPGVEYDMQPKKGPKPIGVGFGGASPPSKPAPPQFGMPAPPSGMGMPPMGMPPMGMQPPMQPPMGAQIPKQPPQMQYPSMPPMTQPVGY